MNYNGNSGKDILLLIPKALLEIKKENILMIFLSGNYNMNPKADNRTKENELCIEHKFGDQRELSVNPGSGIYWLWNGWGTGLDLL